MNSDREMTVFRSCFSFLFALRRDSVWSRSPTFSFPSATSFPRLPLSYNQAHLFPVKAGVPSSLLHRLKEASFGITPETKSPSLIIPKRTKANCLWYLEVSNPFSLTSSPRNQPAISVVGRQFFLFPLGISFCYYLTVAFPSFGFENAPKLIFFPSGFTR